MKLRSHSKTRQTRNMADNIRIEKFSGLTLSNVSPSNFLASLDSYIVLNNLTTDKQKIAVFHLHLEGEALSWFNFLEETEKSSWAKINDAFQSRFVEHNRLNNPDIVIATQMFSSLCLQPAQSISDYYFLIKEKAKTLKKNDTDMLIKFIGGLPSDLAFFVRAGNPQTIDEAFVAARNGEAFGYRALNSASVVNKPSTKDNSHLQTQIDELTKQVSELTSMLKYNNRNFSEQRPITSSTCHRCSGNHGTNQCNMAANTRPRPDLRCTRCYQFGHGISRCTQRPKNY